MFAGILLYTRDDWGIVGVCWWHVLLLCSWVYFYIPMMVGVFLVVLREVCVAAVFIFIILYAMSL